MKSEKWHMTDGMEQSNQEKVRTLGEMETYKYLEILEADTIKQVEIKEKIKKDYLRRTRKLLETKLYDRNLRKNKHLGCHFVKYLGRFLKETREEFKQMDKRTRKPMTMH